MSEVLELKLALNLERQRLLQTQIILLQREYEELQRIQEEQKDNRKWDDIAKEKLG